MADRYEIKGRLGRGGIGAVYQAFDHHLGRDVAIKRLLPIEDTRLNDDTAENSLQSEAKALASLSHPNIVTIFEFGEDEKGPFVVFELIDGDTLKDLIAEGALSESDFYEVADQILDALVAAQKMNILHRDIKPANIMLSWLPSGKFQIKMLDFGLSKFAQGPSTQTLDQQGSFLGSIDYIAPEQIELFPLDQRTDLYSLGCVLYFALTQRAPFTGGSMAETMNNHLAGKAVALEDMRPDIPIAVCRWVMSLVSLHPSERPDDALSAMATLAEAKSISNTSITDSISTAKLVVPVVETAQPSMQPRVLEHTQQIVSTPAPMGPVVPPHPNPNGGNSKMVKGRYKKKPKPPGASRKAIFGLVGSILALLIVGGVIMSNDRKQRNIAAEKERLAKAAEQPAQPSTTTGDTPNQPPEAKPDSTNFANTVAPGPPGLSSDQSLAAYYSFPAGFKNTDGEPLTLDSSNKLVGAMINGAPNAHELHFLKSGEIVNPPQLGANWHGAPTIQIAPNKRLTTTHRGAKSQAMVSEKFTMSFMIRTPEDSNGTILRTAIQDGANTYHNKAFKIAFYKEVMNLFTDSEEEKAQLQFPTKEYRFLMLELDTSEQRISIWNRQRNRNEPFVESPQITFDFPGPIQLQNYEIGNFVPKSATHNKRVEIIAISVHTDLLSMDQKNELANYFYMLTK